MFKLTIVCAFYQDVKLLEQMFKSIEKTGLDCIAIDGRWSEMPGESIASTDGSIEIAKKYATKYIPADESFLKDQISKRNRYIEEIEDGDYFLVLDSDETLVGGVPDVSKLTETVYSIALTEMNRPEETTSIRIHQKRPGLMYALRHCYLFLEQDMNKKAVDLCIKAYEKDKEKIDPKIVEAALQGCLTHQYEYHFLENMQGNPMLIEHWQDTRSLERQNDDGIYMSNRLELQLNQFIKKPADLVEDFWSLKESSEKYNANEEDLCIVKYCGRKRFSDGELGTLESGMQSECTYGYAKKLQEDFSSFAFQIQKIIPKKMTGDNQVINKKLDRLLELTDKKINEVKDLVNDSLKLQEQWIKKINKPDSRIEKKGVKK